MAEQCVLAVGDFTHRHGSELSALAAQAGLGCELGASTAWAMDWLSSHAPHALLIEGSAEEAEQLCAEVRSQASNAYIPILSLVDQLDDLGFAEVFSWGGDDAVQLANERGVLRRLQALPRGLKTSRGPSDHSSQALIGDTDRLRRIVLARVLRNAGYEIRFAVSPDEVEEAAQRYPLDLLVLDTSLADGVAQIARTLMSEREAVVIVTSPPRALSVHQAALAGLPRAAATDAFAPPENVVFLSNELRRGGLNDKRASRRLLYGTTVAFRAAGRPSDDHGFVYNVSEGGLYVRTLAPPEDDAIWLELSPPRTERRVRLEGEVVWRRPYGPAGHATVPPGFGVRIADATQADREAWGSGYRAFAAELAPSA